MVLYKCYFCEGSLSSQEKLKEHELLCDKNPENKNMTSAHFKKIIEFNKNKKH